MLEYVGEVVNDKMTEARGSVGFIKIDISKSKQLINAFAGFSPATWAEIISSL